MGSHCADRHNPITYVMRVSKLTTPAEALRPSTSDSGDLFKYLRVIMLEPAITIGYMWPLGEASASFISRPLALHGQSLASRYGMVSLLISLCIAADCVKNPGAALLDRMFRTQPSTIAVAE